MISAVLTNEDIEKKIAISILAALVAGVLFYGYLVNRAVFEVVERRDIEAEAVALSSQIGELESSYMALKGSIDRNFAIALGFREPVGQRYVSRAPLETAITLNDAR